MKTFHPSIGIRMS